MFVLTDTELYEILYQLQKLDDMDISADYDREALIEKLEEYFEVEQDDE